MEKRVADIFLSPDGNDRWSGTQAEPCADSGAGPFRTWRRAQKELRNIKREREDLTEITVHFGPGSYTEPMFLTEEDGGDVDLKVTLKGPEGKNARISSERFLRGWEKADLSGIPGFTGKENIFCTDAPADCRNITQLYISSRDAFRADDMDAAARERAHFPFEGMYKVDPEGASGASNWACDLSGHSDREIAFMSFAYLNDDIKPDMRNLHDVEIVFYQFWTEARLKIREIDPENRRVLLAMKAFRPLTWCFGYIVDNVFEGLVKEGTWYFDKPSGKIYYHALPGETAENLVARIPTQETLVRICPSVPDKKIENLHFENLTFAFSGWKIPENGFNSGQAETDAPNMLLADHLLRSSVRNCVFRYLGACALWFRTGCREIAVEDNIFTDIGAGAVRVGEVENPADDWHATECVLIRNNLIQNGGQVYLGSAGIWVGQSGKNEIVHNDISSAYQWAISVGWNWKTFPLNRSRDNKVKYNHVHHLGTGILGTHGAIYALGVSPGTEICNNHIHHIYSNEFWGAGEGIILDNGCSGILVENNLVHDASAGGFGCNYNCFGNIIINNIFAYGDKFQLTRYGDPPTDKRIPPNGEIFGYNIVLWKNGPMFMEEDWFCWSTIWDYNLYYNAAGEEVRFLKYTFDEWKEKGMDENSVIADPMFADPENGDYTISPESPAIKLGFKPFPLDDFGLEKGHELSL